MPSSVSVYVAPNSTAASVTGRTAVSPAQRASPTASVCRISNSWATLGMSAVCPLPPTTRVTRRQAPAAVFAASARPLFVYVP